MSDLFMRRSAVISLDGIHRHELRRVWDEALPLLVVCMLNPSRADADRDDPTLLALIHFARLWGYGGLMVVNLYDFRSPDPETMFRDSRRMSAECAQWLLKALDLAKSQATPVLVAWGNDGDREKIGTAFGLAAKSQKVPLVCLGLTLSGAPKHPMSRGKHRIPRDQMPTVWTSLSG